MIGNKKPLLLTIGIPTRNRSRELNRLLSFLSDEISMLVENKVEILISDNASVDDTPSVIEKFTMNFGYIRSVKNSENTGGDANMNKILYESKGKYVWTLGDDDYVVKGAIKKIIYSLEQYPKASYFFLNYETRFSEENIIPSMLKLNKDTIVCDHNKYYSYAENSCTFLSSNIFRKAKWDFNKASEFIGSTYIHALMLPSIICNQTSIILGEILIQQGASPDHLTMIRIFVDGDLTGPDTIFENPVTSFEHSAITGNIKYPETFHIFKNIKTISEILIHEFIKLGYSDEIIRSMKKLCVMETLRQAIYLKRFAIKKYTISELLLLIYLTFILHKSQLLFWLLILPILLSPRGIFKFTVNTMVKIFGTKLRLGNIFDY